MDLETPLAYVFARDLLIPVFLFNPLRRVQAFVVRIFYRIPSDYRQTVRRTKALTSVIALDVVIDRVLQTPTGEMFISMAALFLRTESAGCDEVYRVDGAGSAKATDIILKESSPVIQLLSHARFDLLAHDSIPKEPTYGERIAELLHAFGRRGAVILIPLVFTEELISLLAVGAKLSGRSSTAEDVALLTTHAHERPLPSTTPPRSRNSKISRSCWRSESGSGPRGGRPSVSSWRSPLRLKTLDQLKSDWVSDVDCQKGPRGRFRRLPELPIRVGGSLDTLRQAIERL